MTPERLAEIKRMHATTVWDSIPHSHRGELIEEVERLQEILRRTDIMLRDMSKKHLPGIRAYLGMAGMGFDPEKGNAGEER